MHLRSRVPGLAIAWLTASLSIGLAAMAQPGPVAVAVTEARSAPVRSLVQLPGSVAARVSAVVASLTDGPVVEVGAREGQQVRRGDLLVRLKREELAQDLAAAKARSSEAGARSDLAEQKLARTRELFEAGVISQQQLDDAESESTAWRGRSDEAGADIHRIEIAQRNSRVLAPFAGVVVREHTELGEWVEVGGPVAELIDLSQLEVIVSVPERYFAEALLGTEALVRFDALPKREVAGKIIAVIPRAEARVRAFPVKVGIANPDGQIGVGMSASVAFAFGEALPATVVPKDAILNNGDGQQLYRIETTEAGEIAQPITVRVGHGLGEWVEVTGLDGSLEAGDRVVTRGNERLFPGATVAPQDAVYEFP